MFKAPEPLSNHHKLETFDSGVAPLDEWLKRRAARNQISGASRTYVLCDDDQVAGYYALASGAVTTLVAPGNFRRNMPDPIPVVILGRLAIARTHQGHGLGRALFQDATLRVIHAADSIGIRGMLVHAISDEAKAFYIKLGLDVSPLEPMTLMAAVNDLRTAI